MIRDTYFVPYRKTRTYARAVAQAAIQRASLRYHAAPLWDVTSKASGKKPTPPA